MHTTELEVEIPELLIMNFSPTYHSYNICLLPSSRNDLWQTLFNWLWNDLCASLGLVKLLMTLSLAREKCGRMCFFIYRTGLAHIVRKYACGWQFPRAILSEQEKKNCIQMISKYYKGIIFPFRIKFFSMYANTPLNKRPKKPSEQSGYRISLI